MEIKACMDPAGIEPASLGPKPKRISATLWILPDIWNHKILSIFEGTYLTMILSSREILCRLGEDSHEGDLVIRPYAQECQQPASYDLRIAEDIILPPALCTLVHSLEWVELPANLAATLRCRSSFGRRGVLVTAGYVDPGFRGQLTLGLINMGTDHIALRKNDRVVQVIFHEVCEGAGIYEGRYQDSSGAVEAR